jgi:hypothetical protein
MSALERHHTRTLWLTGVLHAFTHLYQVALMPLYLTGLLCLHAIHRREGDVAPGAATVPLSPLLI